MRFVAFSPLPVGDGSTLEFWINVETPSAVSGNKIIFDDSLKANQLFIPAAYQWSQVKIDLQGERGRERMYTAGRQGRRRRWAISIS